MAFVPDDFDVPARLDLAWCHLRALRVDDNVADFAAWHGSIEQIRATPGFAGRPWPVDDFTLEQNEVDLRQHEADFASRRGFTYAVLDARGGVIGCVYVYPPNPGDPPGIDANVRSWVRADHAERDRDLYRAIVAWLADSWPLTRVAYATRPTNPAGPRDPPIEQEG